MKYLPSNKPNTRIDVADILRGIAIAGIILIHFLEHMNFWLFPEPKNEFWASLNSAVFDTTFFLLAGKMYAIFDMEFAKNMGSLCAKADIVVPNITEACFMLGKEYVTGPYTKEFIEGLMSDLCDMGAKKVVLTGVYFEEGKLGAATYDSETGDISYTFRDTIPGYYHGTGDVYAAALVSALLNGRSLEDSAAIAVDYVVASIQRTFDAGTDVRFGVNFEEGLYDLTKAIKRL